jgi:hypothetical protein
MSGTPVLASTRLLLLLLPLLVLLGGVLAAADTFWDRSLGDALEEARAKGIPCVLAYFPAPAEDAPPPNVARFRLPEQWSAWVVGARVRAHEVQEYVSRFPPLRYPALLLLDSSGDLLYRWEKRWQTQAVVTALRVVERTFREREGEQENAVRALEEEVATGQLEAAVERARTIERPVLTASYRERVERAVAAMESGLEVVLLETLAIEGIATDYRLKRDLGALLNRYPWPSFAANVRTELDRVSARPLGGRS